MFLEVAKNGKQEQKAKIAIIRSQHSIQNEGPKHKKFAYRYSTHQKGLEIITQALDNQGVPYVIDDEDHLEQPNVLPVEEIGVIIVPEIRLCTEKTFQTLIRYAESGWIVFSGRDSFFHDRSEDDQTPQVISSRIRDLFQFDDNSYIKPRKLKKGQIHFNRTRFQWLTKGLPAKVNFADNYFLAVLGDGKNYTSHGDIRCDEAEYNQGIDDRLKNRTLPAFLISEYENGGMFIYGCFTLRKLENFQKILLNLWQFRAQPKSTFNQIRVLKTIVLVQAVVIGLFIGKELNNDSWLNYMIGVGGTLLIAVIANILTNFIDRWISSN